ncbi:metal ABC transporter ATP-binding protein [Schaalia sp. lx-260]|uniref:metal ABC transporter ATP-binding protein n=1 Tax=Schaalia sp. lx-260 TaxID=2899082 RepID=UPI001E589A49|nr:ATP-binding cassette domain-containing protein [Schaalia sp. lx-260]MCD4549447.1 ATP-binding cassette domain-containing protein [Schaalia sp. lx-260]
MQVTAASHTPAGVSTSETPALAVHNLHAAWDSHLIINNISFDLPQGQVLAITGPNGSGKSTLIRSLLANTPLVTGDILFFGHATHSKTFPWKRIGYVPQRSSAHGAISSTCLEVVASGLLSRTKWWLTHKDMTRAREALTHVGLTEYAHLPFAHLSGGQKQRVLIARALVRKPDLLIMDEPMAGIDQESRNQLAHVVASEKEKGHSVLVVLHELGELGPHLDREIHITTGRISYDGPPHLSELPDPAHRDCGYYVERDAHPHAH